MKKDRRKFIKLTSGVGLSLLTLPQLGMRAKDLKVKNGPIEKICVFSKHLQFLDYDEMAETAAEIGFDGVDLTVRPGGHVLPENVKRDLPLAVKAVKKAGLIAPMIATSINDPNDANTRPVLETAAAYGIKHYRMNYFKYDFNLGIINSLKRNQATLKKLIQLNKDYKIVGNYQNHDGTNVGAPIWDLYRLIEIEEPEWIGCQFDIRHATVEGAHSWPIDFQLIAPFIHTLVIKDFKWEKKNGRWVIINTPLGEGMVDFDKFFKMVKKIGVGGPITMHFEYPLTDIASKETEKTQVMAAMKKDLEKLKSLLSVAGLNE